MRFRFHHLSALLALLALTVVPVQGLWASVCPAEMGASVAQGMSVEASTSSGACTHGMAAVSDQAGPSTDGDRPGIPHCPPMPMGVAGSCATMMALPAGTYLSTEPSSPEALLPHFRNDTRDLLIAGAFFRPPIA